MADTQAPKAAEAADYIITNQGNGSRWVNDADGRQVAVDPGQSKTVRMTAAEVKSTERRGDLIVTKSSAKAAKAAGVNPKVDQEPNPNPANPGGGENPPPTVSHIAHAEFGRYFRFTAEGEKVGEAMTEAEARQAANEEKVEFRAKGGTEPEA